MTKISNARKRHIYKAIRIAVGQYLDKLESLNTVTERGSRRRAARVLAVLIAEVQIQNLIFDKYRTMCLKQFNGTSVSTIEEVEKFKVCINEQWPGYSNYTDFFLDAKANGKKRKSDVADQSLGLSRVDSLDKEARFLITIPFIVAAIEHLILFGTIVAKTDGPDDVEPKRSIKTAVGDIALLLGFIKERISDLQGAYGSMNYLKGQRQDCSQRIERGTFRAHPLHDNLLVQSEVIEGARLFFCLKPSYVRGGLHHIFVLPWCSIEREEILSSLQNEQVQEES